MTRRCVALVALMLPAAIALSAQAVHRVPPQGIPVRFPEGTAHGFLDLRMENGTLLARGDLLQAQKENGMEIRMIFHFPDASVFEETVLFTQQRVFALQSYHLLQRGPAFSDDLDASLSANGNYVVKSKAHKDGKTKSYTGTLEMPPDVSNGLVITLLKNLARRDTQTVHIVAFLPEPRMVSLELAPMGEQQVTSGRRSETAVEFALKPHISGITGLLARVLGKMPPDSHVWVVIQDVPAFLRFEGPLYSGPIWRIDLSTPGTPQ